MIKNDFLRLKFSIFCEKKDKKGHRKRMVCVFELESKVIREVGIYCAENESKQE